MEQDRPSESALIAYIPMDRRQALARGDSLPDRTTGAALFADISGFTPLTEALMRALGPRRGADELTVCLNNVYDALIAEVDRYCGSVIGFAGDAITCWFADETGNRKQEAGNKRRESCTPPPASLRATACALAMQRAMRQFAEIHLTSGETLSLAMKASVASGPARRFLVGDPAIQVIDALAGETVVRMAAGEHLAQRGEVIADAQTVERLGEQAAVTEWRVEPESGTRFALVSGLTTPVEPSPWPPLGDAALSAECLRSWLLPTVYDRLSQGLGDILLEMRPRVVTLFLRFEGIDYEGDAAAQEKLDAYIRWVQEIVTRYDGSLLQLIIGDKGSYLYASFGAPIAHEDDPRRAVLTALELRQPPDGANFVRPVQIGVSQGTMRTGAYGGATRRTYGAIGDEVNVSARLMQRAAPGEILVSRRVQRAAGDDFEWESLPPVQVKGKSEPVAVARLVGMSRARVGASAIAYAGALIGRSGELAQLTEFLRPLSEGKFAGLIYVYGEAGVGKSRLVYELRQRVTAPRWFVCPAEQILRQSLYPFKYFLRGYFEQSAEFSEEQNKARFNAALDELLADLRATSHVEIVRELERTRPMLGALVDLHWPGSLYEQLEPKLRFENTLAAFRTLIQAESLRRPLVLHVEDAHWLDTDSEELLKVLTRNVSDYPFAALLTGRYRDDGGRFTVNVEPGVPQQAIDLNTLTTEGIHEMAEQVLDGPVLDDLTNFLAEKTNGNPLFVEQLTLDMLERGLLVVGNEGWSVIRRDVEAPASISAVLVARLDRLAAQVRAIVQTGAVLGNEFEVQVLSRMLRNDPTLHENIHRAEEEQIWLALNEWRYLFRHTLLRDAAYDMQLQSHLQKMHALAAWAIEQVYAADLGAHYADLAYHYGKAGDAAQEFRYAKLAGEHAAARFANQEALAHFERALRSAARLDPAETAAQRQEIYVALGELLVTLGRYEEADAYLHDALTLAVERGDRDGEARACRWLARMYEMQGEYPPALEWVERGLEASGGRETTEAAELLLIAGLIHTRQGAGDRALETCQLALDISRRLGKEATLARAYNLLGHIARLRAENAEAVEYFRQSLALYQQVGNIQGQALAHNQMANSYFDLGQWQEADQNYRQAREIFDRIGDLYNRAIADNNLGEIAGYQGRLDEALAYYREALHTLELGGGSLYIMGILHMNLGRTFVQKREVQAAYQHLRIAENHFEQAQVRDFLPEMYAHWAEAALLADEQAEAEIQGQKALSLARELDMRGEEARALRVLGEIAAAQNDFERAEAYLQQSLAILQEVEDAYAGARSQLTLARLSAAQGKTDAAAAAIEQCIPIFERLEASLDLKTARELQEKLE